MRIKFYEGGAEYEVKDGLMEGYVTLRKTTTGELYENYFTRESMNKKIELGEVVRVDETPEPLSLKIEVDASPLERALAVAKELEATLLRIKELMP